MRITDIFVTSYIKKNTPIINYMSYRDLHCPELLTRSVDMLLWLSQSHPKLKSYFTPKQQIFVSFYKKLLKDK